MAETINTQAVKTRRLQRFGSARILKWILLGVLLLDQSTSTFAQVARGLRRTEPIQQLQSQLYGNSWAIIIGINAYRHWQPLQYAVNDAHAIRDKLTGMGFPDQNISMITDDQATKEQIERILGDELRRKVSEDDRVFIFFAGHGQTEELPGGQREGYLIPVEGSRSDLFSTCISMTTVREFSRRISAKHVFYAIDACYSGLALMRSGGLDRTDRGYLQKISRFPARQLVTAGSAGEQVVEKGGHGAFTNALLAALDGNADKYPPFGVLTGSEIGDYLKPVVSMETNNAQTPQFGRIGPGEGEFLFILPDVVGTHSPTDEPPGPKPSGDPQGPGGIGPGAPPTFDVPRSPRPSPKFPPGTAAPSIQIPGMFTSIDIYEVTNTQFSLFLNQIQMFSNLEIQRLIDLNAQDGGITKRNGRFIPRSGRGAHPVVYVSWLGAKKYCESVGQRLPSVQEWQRACAGKEGNPFPWDGTLSSFHANLFGDDDGYSETSPVGSMSPGRSRDGVHDLIGNVWEWTAASGGDWRRPSLGGGWSSSNPRDTNCKAKQMIGPDFQTGDQGFRCAR